MLAVAQNLSFPRHWHFSWVYQHGTNLRAGSQQNVAVKHVGVAPSALFSCRLVGQHIF
jgi:hypothetical protein